MSIHGLINLGEYSKGKATRTVRLRYTNRGAMERQHSEAIGKKRASAMEKAITGVVLPYKHVECNEELCFIDMSDHVA